MRKLSADGGVGEIADRELQSVGRRRLWGRAGTGLSVAVILSLVAITGCHSRDIKVDSSGVTSLPRADSYNAVIVLGAGSLKIGGTDEAGMSHDMTYYNLNAPNIDCSVDQDSVGQIRVTQPKGFAFGHGESKWALDFSRSHPADLNIRLGIGEIRIAAQELRSRQILVDLGAGEVHLDLSQEWQNDVSVKIDVGLGEVQVKVPRNIGVRLRGDTGLGSMKAPGFEKHGDVWVNDAESTATIHIDLYIDIGLGEIRVIEVEPVPPPARSAMT